MREILVKYIEINIANPFREKNDRAYAHEKYTTNY